MDLGREVVWSKDQKEEKEVINVLLTMFVGRMPKEEFLCST